MRLLSKDPPPTRSGAASAGAAPAYPGAGAGGYGGGAGGDAAVVLSESATILKVEGLGGDFLDVDVV